MATMTVCRGCGVNTDNPAFCSRSCSATITNSTRPKRVANTWRLCRHCGVPCRRRRDQFCNRECETAHRTWGYVGRWLRGEETGYQATSGDVATAVRNFIRSLNGTAACWECGWCRTHSVTGVVPTQIDHIDGDWHNCRSENLRLLCPSCHSLTPTFGGLNKGRGNGPPLQKTTRRSSVG